MALKGKTSYISLYVQNTSSGSGVTGSTTRSFSSIKLRQDGTLGSDIKSTLSLV